MVEEKETARQLRPLFIKFIFYLALKTRQQIPSHKVTFSFLFSHFDFYDEHICLIRE